MFFVWYNILAKYENTIGDSKMNDFFRGKIEACIEISDGDPQKFKKMVMRVTGISPSGFKVLPMTSKAFLMMKRKEKLGDIIDAVV